MRAGCVGAKDCGVLMSVRLPKVMTEATMTYNVRFQNGYDWTAGGKCVLLSPFWCFMTHGT